VKLTVPVGAVGLAEVSVTVVVHVVGTPRATVVGAHETVVVVVCAAAGEMLTVVLPVLAACAVSPAKLAVTVRDPVADGVMLTVQVAVVPVPVRVLQAIVLTMTAPVGVLLVPVSMSVTVTAHEKRVPTVPDAGQDTDVMVDLVVPVTVAEPELVP